MVDTIDFYPNFSLSTHQHLYLIYVQYGGLFFYL